MTPAPAPDNTWRAGVILLATGRATPAASEFDPVWAPLAGAPVLARSVGVFERTPDISAIALVVSPERLAEATALVAAHRWRRTQLLPAAGPHLQDNLRLALNAISPAINWLVVHDAARPLVRPELIAAGLAAVEAQPSVSGAVASIPVNETLKRVHNAVVVETPERSRLALLQTPQLFSRAALLAALDHSTQDFDPPDAASLAVAAGLRLALYPGSPENIRVATADDLALAEALLNGANSAPAAYGE